MQEIADISAFFYFFILSVTLVPVAVAVPCSSTYSTPSGLLGLVLT